MSSKDKNIIRFAVGTQDDPKSWVWRLWVQGDEVYIGAKNSLQAFKVSLHKSGIWRIAFVKELKRSDDTADRVIVKWQKPGEFVPGWTASIAVAVSSIEPARPFKKVRVEDTRIVWFSQPTKGKRLLFKILISSQGMSETDLKKIIVAGDKLAGRLVKTNGEIEKIKDVMDKIKIYLKAGSSEDALNDSRALLVVSEDVPTTTTQPTILDISLGKENLDIATS